MRPSSQVGQTNGDGSKGLMGWGRWGSALGALLQRRRCVGVPSMANLHLSTARALCCPPREFHGPRLALGCPQRRPHPFPHGHFS